MTLDSAPALSLVLWLPAAGAVVVVLLRPYERAQWAGALAVTTLDLVLALACYHHFPTGEAGIPLLERIPWIPSMGVYYTVGADGPALLLVVLTTLLFPIAIGASAHVMMGKDPRESRPTAFLVTMLILQTAITGSLVALDLVLFYLFWEAMLIPMALLIGVWGGPRRIYAAVKFFLFTMVGSLPMLLGILYLYRASGSKTTDLLLLRVGSLSPTEQTWLFVAFGLAFAVKLPLFPFHTWLPDAHTEAPTAGSVILAGILLKLGGYGFYRFAFPLFPEGAAALTPTLLTLSVVGILYGALVSRMQDDIKRLVAYSSISHLGYVMLGLTSQTAEGIAGAFFGMLAHGLATGGLFLIVGMLYHRTHSRQFTAYGGWGQVVPRLSFVTRVVILASCGVPGTAGFWGEILALWGAFKAGGPAMVASIFGLAGMVLSALYMLYFFERIMQGPVNAPRETVGDADAVEVSTLAPLIVLILALGLWPDLALRHSRAASQMRATVRSAALLAPASHIVHPPPGAREVAPHPPARR